MLDEKGPDPALLLSTRTYGVEYDVQEVVGSSFFPDLPEAFRHRDCDGHGTHVASIAAGGNLVANGMTVGVAPEAELMVVKHLDTPDVVLDSSGGLVTPDQRFLDAVIYLLRKARAIAKPIVINASMTNSWQPGDGLGESEWFLDRTFDPTADPAGDPETYPPDNHFPTGAVFVKSAGNDGDASERLTATATIPGSGKISVPVELYDRRAPNARKRVDCVAVRHVPPVSVKAWCRQVIPVVDITVAAKTPGEVGFSTEVASGALAQVFDGGKRWVLSNEVIPMFRPLTTPPGTFGSTWRRRLAMVVEPKPQPSPAAPIHRLGIYELEFKGPPGTVLYLMGTSGGIGMKIAATYADGATPPAAGIRVTNESSMIESGGRHAITVAAHHDITGELAPFSSRGPLRDFTDPPLGALASKPDVSAPGVDIAAAQSFDAGGFLAMLSNRFREGDRETEMDGTSMSAPMVAGIVALMLQGNPNLNVDQARAALTASTVGRPGANPAPADPGYPEAFGAGRAAALESHANTPS
jgi:subtilisin family serine protease